MSPPPPPWLLEAPMRGPTWLGDPPWAAAGVRSANREPSAIPPGDVATSTWLSSPRGLPLVGQSNGMAVEILQVPANPPELVSGARVAGIAALGAGAVAPIVRPWPAAQSESPSGRQHGGLGKMLAWDCRTY